MSLLEQDITKKGQVNKFSELELAVVEDKKYKIEGIRDNAVYNEAVEGKVPGLYYLIPWKSYSKKMTTWETASIVLHLHKMISIFYKAYLKKPTAMFPLLDSVPLMVRPKIKPTTKQKCSRGEPVKQVNKVG